MFPKVSKPKKTIYLDYAATTPLRKEVLKAMSLFWGREYGNPASLYALGVTARKVIENSRKAVAQILGCGVSEVVFTAGGTESVNLAIFGAIRACFERVRRPLHLITSAIEHPAVLNTIKALEKQGHKATFVDVDKAGVINLNNLKKAVRKETVLISVMYANNEIGTVEPIGEIGRWLRQINLQRVKQKLPKIIFHTDACQAAGALDLNINRLGVDLMSLNGSKIYGPKQSGILYVRSGIKLEPLIYGGGQEQGLRSGTENVAGIVGFATALSLAEKERVLESRRLCKLRAEFIKKFLLQVPQAMLNGPAEKKFQGRSPHLKRLPNNINLSILGIEGESLLLYLDAYGISVSTGSACSTGSTDPSHVLLAIGQSLPYIQGSVRLTLGKFTAKKDLDYTLKILIGLIKEFRRISPVRDV